MTSYQLPSLENVAKTLSAFVRREVSVTVAKPGGDGHLPLAGLYHNGNKQLVAACMADVAFAAASSAAFALIPARVTAESVAAQKLDESLAEIFGEVLNVMSRLFTHHENARITLHSTVMPGQPLPAVLGSLSNECCQDFVIDIEGYGKGRLILCLLAV
ncbi:MAG: hypothetical protein V4730_08300 [Pseudomonadota bacterium]